MTFIICNTHKKKRIIELFIREGFGDGNDGRGLHLLDPDGERKEMHKILDDAIDVILNNKKSVCDPERWVDVSLQDLVHKNVPVKD